VFVLEAKGIPLLESWLKDVKTSKGRVRSSETLALVHPDTPRLSEQVMNSTTPWRDDCGNLNTCNLSVAATIQTGESSIPVWGANYSEPRNLYAWFTQLA
jgi:hypothetical protein